LAKAIPELQITTQALQKRLNELFPP